MNTGNKVGQFAVEHPRLIAVVIVGLTLVLTILAVLPSLWPRTFEPLNSLEIDTDPENMLPDDEPVRVFHDRMKEIMSLNDMIVVGVVNPANEEHGVFTPATLERIHALTEFALTLRWRDPENPFKFEGVVEADMIAPSLVDNVESGGAGVVRFEWLMAQPPTTQEEALAIRRKALNLPFLNGTLVSEDGKAVALYLPITAKDVTYRIYSALEQKIDDPSRVFAFEFGRINDLMRQLAAASRNESDSLTADVWSLLDRKTQDKLLQAEKNIDSWNRVVSRLDQVPDEDSRDRAITLLEQRRKAVESMAADLNEWMARPESGASWLAPDHPRGRQLDQEGQTLLAQGSSLDQDGAKRLKRLWLEAAFDQLHKSRVADLADGEEWHITGLPVAEDTFGVQMFKQMAISAPLAMVIIFFLMWFFFRSALVILPAIYDALLATMATMALLVITGNTVHIMSSMIPIFIVPIAVLDDVHVISEFFDRYQETQDRKKTIITLMGNLFTPMLYTTLTTAIGFASLALAPIPPVQVFGLFVAFGVIMAWICSILLVPAFIMVLPQKVLDDFGARHTSNEDDTANLTLLGRILRLTGKGTYRHARLIVIVSIAVLALSGYGISLIRVNDNPTKWFDEGHPIRIADRVLNDHFGGTYMAYLAFRPDDAPLIPERHEAPDETTTPSRQEKGGSGEPALPGNLETRGEAGPSLPSGLSDEKGTSASSGPALPAGLGGTAPQPEPERSATEESAQEAPAKPELFKDPQTLRWIGALQDYMQNELGGRVGKSNSVTDIVETVHRELMVGVERDGRVISAEEAMRVPDTHGAVAQSLLQFQNSHRPQDLWHFVTPDYRTAVVWLQLTSGDNRHMSAVAAGVNDWLRFWDAGTDEAIEMVSLNPDRYRPVLRSVAAFLRDSGVSLAGVDEVIADTPADAVGRLKQNMSGLGADNPLRHDWFGLTYINVVWQEKMVKGMLEAFLGSFLAVFLMMTLLYRSALWGILCMAPLTVTIALTYGLIGFIGKDYDMPVAVLSALSLGLAVDYAIHFLTRSRMMYQDYGSWEKTAGPVFGEPARAIARNAIVVGIGFLPLLLAPLVPYQTVGIFIAAILFLAGVATMLILPAAVTLLENKLFPRTRLACTLCNAGTCIVVIVTVIALIVINVRQFVEVGWSVLTWIAASVIVVLGGWCAWSSRGEKKRTEQFAEKSDDE